MLPVFTRFKMGVGPCSLCMWVLQTVLRRRTLRSESRLSFELWCFMIELRARSIIRGTHADLRK